MKNKLQQPHMILSVENPIVTLAGKVPTHEEAINMLRQQGEDVRESVGMYGSPERSMVVFNPKNPKQIKELARSTGQESFIQSDGKTHKMIYVNGPRTGEFHQGQGTIFPDTKPEDFYSTIKDLQGNDLHFQHNIDTNDARPIPKESLKHPNSYDWQDTPEPIKKSDPVKHVHTETHGPTINDQAGGNKSGKFHEILGQFGTITPNTQTDLKFYHNLEAHLPKIENHVKSSGYTPYVAGGKHGKPDLANKHYGTGHLMIYDPTAGSGGDFGHEDYTKAWRLSHELAHAQTLPEINKMYGEGRRLGKLGVRTVNEAKRAVHWEDLAVKKQREIMAQNGYNMSDDDFNKERNTALADATHRAITGQFTDPNEMGFYPHSHHIPIEHALNIIDQHAAALGLNKTETSFVTEVSNRNKKLDKYMKKDELPGGEADNIPKKVFDQKQLVSGSVHEKEHTTNPEIASEIARDHLVEDPNYYKKLKAMESKRYFKKKLDKCMIKSEDHPNPGPIKDKEFKRLDRHVEHMGKLHDNNPTSENKKKLQGAHAARKAHIDKNPKLKDHINKINLHLNHKYGGNREIIKSEIIFILNDEDLSVLEKALPSFQGDSHPDQPWIGMKHPNGIVMWHSNKDKSTKDDNVLNNRNHIEKFKQKLPKTHHALFDGIVNKIKNDPNRHFIPTQEDGKQKLRARHLKSLLLGDKDVTIDATNPNTLTIKRVTHSMGQNKSSLPIEMKFEGVAHGPIKKNEQGTVARVNNDVFRRFRQNLLHKRTEVHKEKIEKSTSFGNENSVQQRNLGNDRIHNANRGNTNPQTGTTKTVLESNIMKSLRPLLKAVPPKPGAATPVNPQPGTAALPAAPNKTSSPNLSGTPPTIPPVPAMPAPTQQNPTLPPTQQAQPTSVTHQTYFKKLLDEKKGAKEAKRQADLKAFYGAKGQEVPQHLLTPQEAAPLNYQEIKGQHQQMARQEKAKELEDRQKKVGSQLPTESRESKNLDYNELKRMFRESKGTPTEG